MKTKTSVFCILMILAIVILFAGCTTIYVSTLPQDTSKAGPPARPSAWGVVSKKSFVQTGFRPIILQQTNYQEAKT